MDSGVGPSPKAVLSLNKLHESPGRGLEAAGEWSWQHVPSWQTLLGLLPSHAHGSGRTSLVEGPEASGLLSAPLMRHAPLTVPNSPNLFWFGELFAILVTVLLVLFATQLQVSHYLAVRKKHTDKALRMAYPWKSIPSAMEIMEVGPSFATNFQSGLRQSFASRGLSASDAQQVALVSFLIPAEATGGTIWEAAGKTQPRALLERHGRVPAGSLGGKRALARHLKYIKLESLAPMTFLSPWALRKSLEPRAAGLQALLGTKVTNAFGEFGSTPCLVSKDYSLDKHVVTDTLLVSSAYSGYVRQSDR
eukprot:Skav216957  [mRNA]  locus=scaffold2531:34302:36650:+ [translate_table: standard]